MSFRQARKYLWYILRHKYYVSIECFKQGLIWQGITHDMSKFLPSEFKAYAEYFYGEKHCCNCKNFRKNKDNYCYAIFEYMVNIYTNGASRCKMYSKLSEEFDLAWLKHIHRNKHHWQYWLLKEDSGNLKTIDMPVNIIREMVCDWIGAGKAIKGTGGIKETRDWWSTNKNKIMVSEHTRVLIEQLLFSNPIFSNPTLKRLVKK